MVSAISCDLCCFFLCMNRFNSFSRYLASLAYTQGRMKKERSQKIDNLPILATCWSGTLVIFSSEVDGPVAHGSEAILQ